MKQKPFRSRKYLDWVKQQPCIICGAQADDPHHLVGVGGMGGMGTKAPDSMVLPVCRIHHGEIHADPLCWHEQWQWIARTLDKALRDGVLEVV